MALLQNGDPRGARAGTDGRGPFAPSGSPALASRARLTVTRSTDGATLFTGSLATFHSLRVTPGSSLVLRVQKPAGFGGLRAGAALRWS